MEKFGLACQVHCLENRGDPNQKPLHFYISRLSLCMEAYEIQVCRLGFGYKRLGSEERLHLDEPA